MVGSTTENSHTFLGLENGKEYIFGVAAIYENGNSDVSSISSIPWNNVMFDPLQIELDTLINDEIFDYDFSFEVSPDLKTPSSNEAIGTELSDGSLMLNVREQNGARKERLIAISTTGGKQWDTEYFDTELISPVCQSSVLLFKGKQDTILLYSGPNSRTNREKMTVKGSLDSGKKWVLEKEIYSGTSAYSDLVQIDANTIGLFYERDNNGIYFSRLPISELQSTLK